MRLNITFHYRAEVEMVVISHRCVCVCVCVCACVCESKYVSGAAGYAIVG